MAATSDVIDLTGDTKSHTIVDDYINLALSLSSHIIPHGDTNKDYAGKYWFGKDNELIVWVHDSENIAWMLEKMPEHLVEDITADDVVGLNKEWYRGLTATSQMTGGTILALNFEGKNFIENREDSEDSEDSESLENSQNSQNSEEESWFDRYMKTQRKQRKQRKQRNKARQKFRAFTGRKYILKKQRGEEVQLSDRAKAFLHRHTINNKQ